MVYVVLKRTASAGLASVENAESSLNELIDVFEQPPSHEVLTDDSLDRLKELLRLDCAHQSSIGRQTSKSCETRPEDFSRQFREFFARREVGAESRRLADQPI